MLLMHNQRCYKMNPAKISTHTVYMYWISGSYMLPRFGSNFTKPYWTEGYYE